MVFFIYVKNSPCTILYKKNNKNEQYPPDEIIFADNLIPSTTGADKKYESLRGKLTYMKDISYFVEFKNNNSEKYHPYFIYETIFFISSHKDKFSKSRVLVSLYNKYIGKFRQSVSFDYFQDNSTIAHPDNNIYCVYDDFYAEYNSFCTKDIDKANSNSSQALLRDILLSTEFVYSSKNHSIDVFAN